MMPDLIGFEVFSGKGVGPFEFFREVGLEGEQGAEAILPEKGESARSTDIIRSEFLTIRCNAPGSCGSHAP